MFSDSFLETLGAWQNGWKENQELRTKLADKLLSESAKISDEFRKVDRVCYRKRFLHYGELLEIIMVDSKNEGIVSWTQDQAYAERFKGLYKPSAVSGAIFEHTPKEAEVVVNICALWESEEFIDAVRVYTNKKGLHCEALNNFKATQGEVILSSPLKGSEIIALTGASSPFDDLCDELKVPEEMRDEYFRQLVNQGICPEEIKYTSKEGTQRVIAKTIKAFEAKMVSLK
ncbi:conserved hypothetical protein [Vibrio chagasii]|uniref:hypothetical protein n=1 Tax=Vibrio coralliirubri TaxID=1516159 RepID=UPI00062ECC18|nr:hypothetical protein [Vibrio coralliirubri]CAH6803384.1 conserved hypothetical protein [Vibrio chagasii]CAH6840230.1 conserved hypothetical protein [Vibrio chagasii]CAH6842148.1 conserved hypothetical protein [Vibrio chagasii]CAH7064568.1 conserved hypothetical protein [Vibrio chagasii]CAH7097119.1 conserved hypothetical protein [Vibrio chagasii]